MFFGQDEKLTYLHRNGANERADNLMKIQDKMIKAGVRADMPC